MYYTAHYDSPLGGIRLVEKDGKRSLSQADCAYGTCPHTETCLLMRQADKNMET